MRKSTGNMQDPYMNEEMVIKRLRKEYDKHGKLIIAYDYDYTINSYRDESWTYPEVVKLLGDWRGRAHFICYTASPETRYNEIRDKVKKLNVPLDYINENFPKPDIPKGVKLYYNILLDDRAGLGECVRVLRKLLIEIEKDESQN